MFKHDTSKYTAILECGEKLHIFKGGRVWISGGQKYWKPQNSSAIYFVADVDEDQKMVLVSSALEDIA